MHHNRASSCRLHITNPGEQLWNMHQWRAKGNIIYILQLEVSRLASSNLRGTSMCVSESVSVCVCLCVPMSLYESMCESVLFGVFAQLCVSVTILTCYYEPSAWTLGCAALQLPHMTVWQDSQLSHRQHIYSSLSPWPQLINQVTVPLNCQSEPYSRYSLFPGMEISDKKRHIKALSLPPKSRAVKKTKVMIGYKWRRAGRDEEKGPGS